MDIHRKKQILRWTGWGAGGLLFLVLLPLTLPAVLGILISAVLDPLVLRLQRKTGMGRGTSSALCVSGVLIAALGTIWTLGRILIRELIGLSRQLPALLETAAGYAAAFSQWLQSLGDRLPDGAGDAVRAWASSIVGGSGTLAQGIYEKIFSLVTRLLSALPGSLFFLLTLVLSCYFASAELPRLRELAKLHLPSHALDKMGAMTAGLKSAAGGWVRAQVLLMAVTFLVLTAGFLLLRISSPLLLGLGIALMDALPLLGTGTVLLPWALAALLSGNTGLGIGLAGLYGAAALLRNVLEPRLLGAQLGVSPLMTLIAIYGGWRIGGFWGMVLFPIGTMTALQLWQSAREPAAHSASVGHGPVQMQKIPKSH